METLEIVIGLIFIYLLLSLLGTTAQEIWASLTSLRGKVLLKGIIKLLEVENMGGENATTRNRIVEDFKKRIIQSKIYQKYSTKYLWVKQLPSYLSSEQVTGLIQELLGEDTPAPESYQTRSLTGDTTSEAVPLTLANIRQDDLRKQLNIIHQSDATRPPTMTRSLSGEPPAAPEVETDENKIAEAKAAFKKHYDEIMDRATGWYKKAIQVHLLVIGFLIAFAFDADTFKIYSNLTHYPDDRQKLLQLAESFTDNNKIEAYTPPKDTTNNNGAPQSDSSAVAKVGELRGILDSILVNEIQNVPSPLGLGRQNLKIQNPPPGTKSPLLWRVQKFFGWLVTALAISLGAPFWFDLLQKVINIRAAGVRPQDAEKKRTSTP